MSDVFSATVTEGIRQLTVSWNNPTSDFDAIQVQRTTGIAPTGADDGTTVYDASGNSFVDTGLTPNVKYFYGIYPYKDI